MFRLTREVRFGIDTWTDDVVDSKNGHAGRPALTGLGYYFELQATLAGPLEASSSYLRNIKHVDDAVRGRAIPIIRRAIESRTFGGGGGVVRDCFVELESAWPGATLSRLVMRLSPFLNWGVERNQSTASKDSGSLMIKLSQRFEFSAAHRLHNPGLDDAQNVQLFGKCNNPLGHGHNYEVEVTLRGTPDSRGVLMPVGEFESLVELHAIDAFDHKHLNMEVEEFRLEGGLNPSVENIAMVIYRRLRPVFVNAQLDSVTVWETPKTWCEYRE